MKFTPPGGAVTIQTSLHRGDSDVMRIASKISEQPLGILKIEVIDNGKGISFENKPKVFGEFVQFDANKNQAGGGSGLGLMISKNLIQMHGGTMSFDSEGEGKGSTFYFDLPVYASRGVLAGIRNRISFKIRNGSSYPPDSDIIRRQSFVERLPPISSESSEILGYSTFTNYISIYSSNRNFYM
jgi:hypothetical protein